MSFSIHFPGSLLAAQMISHAKGQEVQSRLSSERKERDRLLGQGIVQAKEAKKHQEQAAGSHKGTLA